MAVVMTSDAGCDIVRLRAAIDDDLAVRDLTAQCRALEKELDDAEAALKDLHGRLQRDILAKDLARLDVLYRNLEKAQQRAETHERARQKSEQLQLRKIAARDDLKAAQRYIRNLGVAWGKIQAHEREVRRYGGSLFSHSFDRDLIQRCSCELTENPENRTWTLRPL